MPPTTSAPAPAPSHRLTSIDQLRGSVMLLMLLDHVRETFYLHHQVADPVDVEQTAPALFLCRLLAHLCAPVFVLLTGLAAWLYGQGKDRRAVAAFLATRGLFLVLLELTLVNVAWTFELPPRTIYLQVIWAIGLSMLALAALLWLPRAALLALGVALVAGHNLLDGWRPQGEAAGALWAVLHQRGWLQPFDGLRLRTSYPVLPWIGVIALGYALGPWFARGADAWRRQRLLLGSGLAALTAFALLRWADVYGDAPRLHAGGDALLAAMSFLNVTKYPPSLLFLLLTLGVGLLLLRLYEAPRLAIWLRPLADIGAAPMFFYLLHLYVLKLLYLASVAIWGHNRGGYFGVEPVATLLLIAALLGVALYWPTRAFARLKARRRDLAWLRYF
jgi:uncharacterized membrane protein